MDDDLLVCPYCGSSKIIVTEEDMWFLNTGEHVCQSVKMGDDEAKVECADCEWQGIRAALDYFKNESTK